MVLYCRSLLQPRTVHAAYLDALGSAMLMLCRAVPHGVLCFFPSWGLLNAARDQWLVTGTVSCLLSHCLYLSQPQPESCVIISVMLLMCILCVLHIQHAMQKRRYQAAHGHTASIASVHFSQCVKAAFITMEQSTCLSMPAVTYNGWLCMALQRLMSLTAPVVVCIAHFKVVCACLCACESCSRC